MRLNIIYIFTMSFVVSTLAAVPEEDRFSRVVTREQQMAARVTDFTARLGREVLDYSIARNESVAFSPFHVFTSLVRIQRRAEEVVRKEILDVLGLWEFREGEVCGVLNNLTTFLPCFSRTNFTVSYRQFLFLDLSLNLVPSALTDSCVRDEYLLTDFSQRNLTESRINDWFRRATLQWDLDQLDRPLPLDSKTLFVSTLRHTNLSTLGYRLSQNDDYFVDIVDNNHRFPMMEKMGAFAEHTVIGQDYTETILVVRDDLPGGRYCFLFVYRGGSLDPYEKFVKIFEPETFKKVIKEGSHNGPTKNMTLVLPHLSLISRMDVREPLERLCVMSLFSKVNPLRGMVHSPFYFEEFPHTEAVRFQLFNNSAPSLKGAQADKKGGNKSDQKLIATPFVFLLVDKYNDLPLTGVIFTGLGVEDKKNM